MVVAALKKNKASAPGQYLGYGLQPVRLCHYLLSVPAGKSVSMEYLDDVAIHDESGSIILEQTKSSLSGNPTNDRSTELWKALANWSDLFSEGDADISSATLKYFVTPTKEGSLVAQLHSAPGDDEAADLLKLFKSNSFQRAPGKGIEPQIQRFLIAGDDICLEIIKRFNLESLPDPIEPIREKLQSVLPQETIDDFCAAAIGMAKDEIDELIRNRRPPIIDAEAFRRRFRAFVRKYNFSNILTPTIEAPSSEEVTSILQKLPIFVRQLAAVGASENLITTAVSDFLRATSDKTSWAAEGEIFESSLDELDESLLRHHLVGQDEIEDLWCNLSPEDRGRKLYRKCIDLQIPLEGKSLPTYFVPGEFNCLADDCRLGWHPEYRNLFSGDA